MSLGRKRFEEGATQRPHAVSLLGRIRPPSHSPQTPWVILRTHSESLGRLLAPAQTDFLAGCLPWKARPFDFTCSLTTETSCHPSALALKMG